MQLHRKCISAIAAASIMITGFGSTSAQADDDVGRVLAAILGIAIIGAAINDHNDSRRPQADHHRRPVVDPFHNPRVKPRPVPRRAKPQRARSKALPAQCLRSHRAQGGTVRMFGKRCLQNNYRGAHRLPSRCERQVWTRNGTRSGYGVKCLRNSGYKIARS